MTDDSTLCDYSQNFKAKKLFKWGYIPHGLLMFASSCKKEEIVTPAKSLYQRLGRNIAILK